MLPVMVHDDKVTVPLLMYTPPPYPDPTEAMLLVIEQDVIVTVPE
jgi:hypothetical protein